MADDGKVVAIEIWGVSTMGPKLQIALDCIDLDETFRIADMVREYADILEIGTVLLKKEGISAIKRIKAAFPDKLVFVDTKTVDFGRDEARTVFNAGADMMSVCGVASDMTITFALQEAHKHGKKVLIDLIGLGDSYRQVKRFSYLQPDYITVYTGVDERTTYNNLFEKVEIISQISSIPLAVAGGIQLDDIPYLLVFNPAIIIVGAAITLHTSPQESAKQFWESIHHPPFPPFDYLN